MTDQNWMDAASACAALGVRRQTLYAYVSRGLLQACSDPSDPRKSLYLQSDVTRLADKHRRPRARADVAAAAIRWGDPVLDTAVSEVRDGVLYFGANLATDLAQSMTLEDLAAHHWKAPFAPPPVGRHKANGPTALARAMIRMAKLSARAPALSGRTRADIARDGAGLLQDITAACLRQSPDPAPAHQQLAQGWNAPEAADIIRRALVLISDHDLNPSTFAVRVCASTGASLPAAVLAGLSTLSGPRHGGASALAAQAIRAGETPDTMQAFVQDHADLSPYAYGFGHPHYPQGDCRAAHLFDILGPDCPAVQQAHNMARHLGIPPNIDAGLAALVMHHGLPQDASAILFAVGRTVGWIAHAIEQVESGDIIRPKARFVG